VKLAATGTRDMDFESVMEMLKSYDMEEVPAPQSADIFNIFCKKDGEHIDTIQRLEGEGQNMRRFIAPLAYRWMERAMKNHRVQHQPNYQVSFYEGTKEQSALKPTY
jgi:hypothetical protein